MGIKKTGKNSGGGKNDTLILVVLVIGFILYRQYSSPPSSYLPATIKTEKSSPTPSPSDQPAEVVHEKIEQKTKIQDSNSYKMIPLNLIQKEQLVGLYNRLQRVNYTQDKVIEYLAWKLADTRARNKFNYDKVVTGFSTSIKNKKIEYWNEIYSEKRRMVRKVEDACSDASDKLKPIFNEYETNNKLYMIN